MAEFTLTQFDEARTILESEVFSKVDDATYSYLKEFVDDVQHELEKYQKESIQLKRRLEEIESRKKK